MVAASTTTFDLVRGLHDGSGKYRNSISSVKMTVYPPNYIILCFLILSYDVIIACFYFSIFILFYTNLRYCHFLVFFIHFFISILVNFSFYFRDIVFYYFLTLFSYFQFIYQQSIKKNYFYVFFIS